MYKKRLDGNVSSLTDSRIRRLEHIGFHWGERRGLHNWNKRYVSTLMLVVKIH